MASYDVEEILDSRKKGDNEENGDQNQDDDEDDEQTDDEKANISKRGTPRKAAKAGNRKRKAAQKSVSKRTKRRR